MLDFVFNNFTTDKKYGAEFFRKIIRKALKELGFNNKAVELSINLVGKGRIKALNKKYLGKNKATDVLSFPLNERVGIKPPRSGIIALGDIFICLPVVKECALKEDKGLSSQFAILVVHGLLHLLGCDHEKSGEERQKMFRLQEKILKQLAISI